VNGSGYLAEAGNREAERCFFQAEEYFSENGGKMIEKGGETG